MSNATLDRPKTNVTPFALLWAEELHTEVTGESEWFFSEPTQGLTSISASSQDKIVPTHMGTDPDGDGGDVQTRSG